MNTVIHVEGSHVHIRIKKQLLFIRDTYKNTKKGCDSSTACQAKQIFVEKILLDENTIQ